MPAPPRQPRRPQQPHQPSRPVRDRARAPRGSSRTGTSGPGRAGAPARAPRPSRAPGGSGTARAATTRRTTATVPAAKPRLTGRAAILVLVLAVLAVSYASSLRAYLEQRETIETLQSTITERQAAIDDLERERDRWLDPEFVEIQARERLGYVMPGETPFVALRDGEPLETGSELTDPASIGSEEVPRAFWEDAWETVLVAGNPPRRADPPPLTRIDPPEAGSE